VKKKIERVDHMKCIANALIGSLKNEIRLSLKQAYHNAI
jgi:hypothetical protein